MPSEPTDTTAAARRYALLALKLGVSVALLALVFSRIDAARLWATARQASPAWLVGALLLYSINVLASTWRWHVLLEAQRIDVPRRGQRAGPDRAGPDRDR